MAKMLHREFLGNKMASSDIHSLNDQSCRALAAITFVRYWVSAGTVMAVSLGLLDATLGVTADPILRPRPCLYR